MPNFCPRCNVATDPDADFCAACGTRLNGRAKNNGKDGADAAETARYLQPTVGPSFWGAPLHCLKNYCVFRGRATRTEFWGWFVPWAAVVFIAAPTVASVLTANVDDAAAGAGKFYCFWLGATFLPSLAVFARRLHDVGKSAKRALLSVVAGGVSGALLLVGTALGEIPYNTELHDEVLLLSAVFVPTAIASFRAAITAGFGDGMREPNRWGGRRANPA
ncbi:MAG: zinc-ribbon domain-containing protein [Thermoguttaceae bacterium]|nr:zinc-ribbon domain-containing protein [Thermoguttaceae bacterium]